MNRLPTSRQVLSAKQRNCNYVPNFALADHVRLATVERNSVEPVLIEGETVLVSSKFAGRYYTCQEINGRWTCSARDREVAARCIATAKAHSLVAA